MGKKWNILGGTKISLWYVDTEQLLHQTHSKNGDERLQLINESGLQGIQLVHWYGLGKKRKFRSRTMVWLFAQTNGPLPCGQQMHIVSDNLFKCRNDFTFKRYEFKFTYLNYTSTSLFEDHPFKLFGDAAHTDAQYCATNLALPEPLNTISQNAHSRGVLFGGCWVIIFTGEDFDQS